MKRSTRNLSRPQKLALSWIRVIGPATRLSELRWQPGGHQLQTRRINHSTIESLVDRCELRYTMSIVKRGCMWPTIAEIEEGLE